VLVPDQTGQPDELPITGLAKAAGAGGSHSKDCQYREIRTSKSKNSRHICEKLLLRLISIPCRRIQGFDESDLCSSTGRRLRPLPGMMLSLHFDCCMN
jgi:hypothetical protein